MVTGEERRYADEDGNGASYVARTVEMTNLTTISKRMNSSWSEDDVAVIDEIQMMRDPQRGWAWTRALLGKPHGLSLDYRSSLSSAGIQAKEIHLRDESSTIRLVQELMATTADELEIWEYQRLTKLNYEDRAFGEYSS